MRFDTLFEDVAKHLPVETTESGNEIIRIPKGAVRVRVGNYGASYGPHETFADVTCISKHFVTKPIYSITVRKDSRSDDTLTVRTTEDHTCMRVREDESDEDGDFIFEQVSAKDLRKGDLLCVCNVEEWFGETYCDTRMPVLDVTVDENSGGQWVYDLEVDSHNHVYFANGVLVHNSQFINLSPITQSVERRERVPADTPFSAIAPEQQKEVIDEAYHILDLANANVAKLMNESCFTRHGDIVHYSLEYIAAEGMYFKKKHYIVRKVLSDDIPCDKFKYSGISVKKAEIPASMKDFLKRIYESTMKEVWSEARYRKEVEGAFTSFTNLDWEDISYWRKYRTPKRIISLTESEKGAGVHARAANFYNQLIEKLGLAGKYPKIGAGDEFRYVYILPTNVYGMDCIAFKGKFPDEFRALFKPDYETMFEKIFTKSLENYVKIMKYRKMDPTKREEAPEFSIF